MTLPEDSTADPGTVPEKGSQSIRARALSGAALVGLRGFAIRGIGFLSSIVLARLLVPADFGTLSFGQAILAFAGELGNVGIGAALIQRAEPPTRREKQALLGLQGGILTTIVTAVIVVAALNGSRTAGVTALLAIALPLSALRTPTVLSFERELLFGRLAFVEVFETLVYSVLAIGLVAAGAGVWGVAVATLARSAVGSVYLLARDPDRVLLPRIDMPLLRPLIGFGIRVQLSGALVMMRSQGVNLATAAISGLGTLGLWSLAERVMAIPFVLFDSLWRVTFPAIARLLEQGEDPTQDLERSLRIGTVLTGLVLVGISASAPAAIPAVFGPEWQDTAAAIPSAALGLVILGPVSACCGGYLYAIGKAQANVTGVVASIVAWTVIGLPLLPVLGAAANGVGWAAASVAEAVVLVRALRDHTTMRVLPNVAPATLAAIAVGGAGYLVALGMAPTLLSAFAVGIAATVVFVVVLRVFAGPALRDAIAIGRRLSRSAFGSSR